MTAVVQQDATVDASRLNLHSHRRPPMGDDVMMQTVGRSMQANTDLSR
jgi:hypothetical protein